MTPPELPRVLVVDDNLEMARMIADGLEDAGYQAVPLASGLQAIALCEREHFDAVVTDLRMPDADGLAVLAASRRVAPERPVLIMTAFSAIDTAIESIRRGAYHYLTKPFKSDELVIFLGRALEEVRLRREASALETARRERFSIQHIAGQSAPMRAVLDMIARLAPSRSPVLIFGETGTGKGLVARALHAESPRASGPFVAVNCAALPEALLESELFGHVKGAFTGAVTSRRGLFVEASGGTLLLDEIGEMAPAVQAKLLHALERGAVRPLGAEKEQPVDVRILAATHRDLRKAAREGRFREDLLYRLDVVSIEMPALRNRREDILPLAERFLVEARKRHPDAKVERLSTAVAERLMAHEWPGNVRELEHVIERVVLLGREAEAKLEDLPVAVRGAADAPGHLFWGEVMPIRELQRQYAAWVLERMGGHRGRTAEKLGIDEKTLWKWLSDKDLSKDS